MTVDLSKAKAGQIAHFRCGGSAKITKMINAHNVSFDDSGTYYSLSGKYGASQDERVFDIIRLEETPFDWKDEKPGIAFLRKNEVYHYVGESLEESTCAIFMCPESYCTIYDGFSKHLFERSPSHDIQVKS